MTEDDVVTEDLETQDSDQLAGASEIPPILYWTLWVPVFCVILYGMTRLFGTRGGFAIEPIGEDGDAPPDPDKTEHQKEE
ncbi:MAG: hypothetical protein HN348_10425 [Proteobacteria bacterium]|nr:hypothetical protein [Pseudomonadota bacterium]